MNVYLTFKALHLISVISWMAGLLYLPRIFVYHSETIENKKSVRNFQAYGKKTIFLYNEPSNGIVLDFWNFLFILKGLHSLGFFWMQIKLGLVIILTSYHFYLLAVLKDFQIDNNKKSSKFFRIINEVPTILLIIIIFIVVFKPL